MKTFFTSLLLILSIYALAQYGGSYTYAYLNLPPSARISALGGLNISTYDDDVNLSYQNPSLLNEDMNGRLSISNAFLPAGINQGYIAYAKYINKWNITTGGGLLYRAYGTFELTDETGTRLGSFKAGEYALSGGAAYKADKLSYGANLKLLYSQLESYNSFGAALDIGATFYDSTRRFCAAVVMRNIGTQLKPYTSGNREELPFEIDFGLSKKLAHLPLQLSFTLHDLQAFDIRYDDPNRNDLVNIFDTDSVVEEKNYTVDKIFRHLNVGGEFFFGKNFRVRIGYDHMTRQEMSIDTRRGLTGFSTGFGLKINKYYIDYGHEFYSLAGGSNHITIGTNLSAFLRNN